MSHSRPCPACGDLGPHRELRIREMWFAFDESFGYLECRGCGTVYIAEVPENLARYYEPDKYYSLRSDAEQVLGRPGVAQVVGALGRSILSGRDVLGRLMERAPNRNVYMMAGGFRAVASAGSAAGMDGRVLDVGAGTGLLVYALHLAGMTGAEGVDPFLTEDVSYRNGARVRRADLGEVEGTYDVIMLNHSFEHVPDPGQTLDQLRSRLAPGGRGVIRIPTVSSHAYDTYGVDWYSLDAPRHLTIFSRQGMQALCEKHGFTVVRVVDDGNSAQFWASEQIRRDIPLASPASHYLDPRGSDFSARQVWRWEREARALNTRGRGDQAGWVIERSSDA
jgi:SAM-dependent methyltransferase